MADPSGVIPQIPAAEAISLVAAGTPLLDVREQHEWDAGHASAAQFIPMSAIESRAGEVPVDRRVLVVCRTGQRSARVTDALIRAGYDAVNVEGGMVAWRDAGGDMVSAGPDAPRV
jgi:rhodanese-related sulfurtransferase